jgi:hypothetical protein
MIEKLIVFFDGNIISGKNKTISFEKQKFTINDFISFAYHIIMSTS